MKRKGFTLIELLAVIIILAVIALIATPVVLNVINNARKQANKDSAYGILDSAKLYYADSLLVDGNNSNLNGTTNLIDKISISGDKPDSGVVYINDKGETAIAVVYDKICYIKNFNENDIKESNDVENCNLGVEETEPIEDFTAPEVSISSVSTRTDAATVVAICEDLESGIKKYEYSKDNGATYVSAGTTYTFTGLAQDTEYTFTVRCTNGVDLTEVSTTTATTTLVNAPTISQTSQTPNDSEYAQQRIIRITYSNENLVGAKHYYSLDGTNFLEAPTLTHDLTFTSNGQVYAKTEDAAGNVATASTYTVANIDTTKPSSSITIGTIRSNKISILANCNDTESGITKYEFSKDSGNTWVDNGTSDSYTFTDLEPSTSYTFNVRCTNGSGITEVTSESATTSEVVYRCKRATTLHTEVCNKKTCQDAGYTTSGSEGTTTITFGSLGTAGTLASGDAFDCDVNGDGTYDASTERFYYVSDLYDTSTNTFNDEYAVLIYYNNTTKGMPDSSSGGLVAYNTANTYKYGPVTAVKNLPTSTQWSNVSLSNSIRTILNSNSVIQVESYSYEGYAARLLTTQEIKAGCNTITPKQELNNKCNYLMENTKYSSSSAGTYGYWLETVHIASGQIMIVMGGSNYLFNHSPDETSYDAVRPAIEVLKSEIQY